MVGAESIAFARKRPDKDAPDAKYLEQFFAQT